jgi:serine phosphatase RsbU (regulator of sigma subunit)
MRLRTAVFAGGVLLVTLVVAAVAVSVYVVVDRSARREVDDALGRSAGVLVDVMAYQQAQLANDARLIADEPRIKALFGADIDPATIAGEAARARERIGASLLLMVDAEGTLLIDVDHPEDTGTVLTQNPVTGPVVKAALEKGQGSGVWTSGERVYRVQSQSIRFGDDVRGAVLIGQQLGDREARTIASQVGSDVILLLGDQAVASSIGARDPDDGWATARTGFPGYTGARPLSVLLLQDLDAELAPGRRVMRVLTAVFVAAILAAIGLALFVSRRMARPLDGLVAFTRKIADGDLEARCEARGLAEVVALGASMNHMVGELAQSRRLLAEKERLERELQIASRIQTSILPNRPALEGYRIATHMATADEVGGDYYDIHQTRAGGWIAIGDVSGHGLDAGLIMMMVQTAVSSLVRTSPSALPSAVLGAVNQVIFDNIHARLQVERHMTLSLLRIEGGQVTFAGAHMDILVRSAATGECRVVETPGAWIGIADDIGEHTVDGQLTLEAGDIMVLYTDGVTEATDGQGELFGLERLIATVAGTACPGPEEIVDAIVRAVDDFQAEQFDDFSVVVARREVG